MNKSSLTFPLLLCLLIGLVLFSLSWGRFAIPLENVVQSLIGGNTNDVQNNIIFN
ncbi:MAG: iron ABC transporter permease, partial [Haemophilus parainfluenzae]|nr:iron ABC transporter permease [Haemophilus parainfluenzae]